MTLPIVVLYGPPASGKDTVTRELESLGRDYVHFHRLKSGPGRTEGYRLTTADELDSLDARGELLYVNHAYESTYAVDRPGLSRLLEAARVPVIHLGQVAGIRALHAADDLAPLLVAGLWCDRDEAGRRMSGRDDQRRAERLQVWDRTLSDLHSADPSIFTLILNTGTVSPHHAARVIDACRDAL